MISMLQKIHHAMSGCPDCKIVKKPEYNDVKISAACRARMEQERKGEHDCNADAEVDIDLCTECGEHSGFCSICGGSQCCGAGAYQPE